MNKFEYFHPNFDDLTMYATYNVGDYKKLFKSSQWKIGYYRINKSVFDWFDIFNLRDQNDNFQTLIRQELQ